MLALSHQNSALLTTTSSYLLILLTCVATWSSISRKNLFFYFNCVLLSYYRPMTLTVRGRRKDSREKQKKTWWSWGRRRYKLQRCRAALSIPIFMVCIKMNIIRANQGYFYTHCTVAVRSHSRMHLSLLIGCQDNHEHVIKMY